jgi:prepilin-type N-terminal cleavage/methylation domain-containing protein
MLAISHIVGFSLIELMIAVAIIGILTMIGLPSYQNYLQRARFAEVISTTEIYKTAVTLALQQGSLAAELTNGKDGIPGEPKSTKNLDSIKVEKGIITATGTDIVNHATYILKPNNDGTNWSVSGTCFKSRLCNA